jgi:hypothetical protein
VTAIGPSLGSVIGAWAKAGSQNKMQTPAATTKFAAIATSAVIGRNATHATAATLSHHGVAG